MIENPLSAKALTAKILYSLIKGDVFKWTKYSFMLKTNINTYVITSVTCEHIYIKIKQLHLFISYWLTSTITTSPKQMYLLDGRHLSLYIYALTTHIACIHPSSDILFSILSIKAKEKWSHQLKNMHLFQPMLYHRSAAAGRVFLKSGRYLKLQFWSNHS